MSLFRLLIFQHKISLTNACPSVFFLAFVLEPQNSKSLKFCANDEPGFLNGQFYSTNQDIAKNLAKGQFAQNLKNRSDIYEHVRNKLNENLKAEHLAVQHVVSSRMQIIYKSKVVDISSVKNGHFCLL